MLMTIEKDLLPLDRQNTDERVNFQIVLRYCHKNPWS